MARAVHAPHLNVSFFLKHDDDIDQRWWWCGLNGTSVNGIKFKGHCLATALNLNISAQPYSVLTTLPIMPSIGPALPPHLQAAARPTEESDEDDYAPSIGPVIPSSGEAGPKLPAGPQLPAASSSVGPQLPPSLARPSNIAEDDDEEDEDAYLPALPPDLAPSKPAARVQGPAMPPGVGARYTGDSDSEDDVGPMPLPAGLSDTKVDAVQEFRAREEARRKAAEVRTHSWCSVTGIWFYLRVHRKQRNPKKCSDRSGC